MTAREPRCPARYVMTKAVMYREPLERYIHMKLLTEVPGPIGRVKVRKLKERYGGCNWDIQRIESNIPAETAAEIDRRVIAPLRDSIDLAE